MYKCGNCGNECTPIMSNVGISASCCEEAVVLVVDAYEVRTMTKAEESDVIEELWAAADAERTPAERARARVMGGPR